MSVLCVINSDPEVKRSVEVAFQHNPDHNFELFFLAQEDEILEFLNYTLPELIVVNFSDPEVNIEGIINYIKNDKWIFNLGIIGLCNSEKDNEEVLKKYKESNILTQLDSYRLKTHLVKSIQVIEQNYQVIFQREFTKSLFEDVSGSFIIDNDLLAVPLYSSIGATLLAQRGFINPSIKMHLQLALAELIVNAIEHGNCGISYEEKTKALSEGISSPKLVADKCKDPAIQAKRVTFNWEIKQDRSMFTIQDEGEGFDVRAYIEKLKRQDKYSLHGRGMRMAANFLRQLRYNAKGNRVTVVINHDTVEHEVPAGFSGEQAIHVKKGDIVMKEGELSNYLYYISSGTYDVFHNDKLVGTLSARDIFMGEMSFLLNQRRSATIIATSSGKLTLVTQKAFINVIREYPHYGIFLSKLLAKRLLRSNEQVASRMSD